MIRGCYCFGSRGSVCFLLMFYCPRKEYQAIHARPCEICYPSPNRTTTIDHFWYIKIQLDSEVLNKQKKWINMCIQLPLFVSSKAPSTGIRIFSHPQLFLSGTATVHTYPANSAANPEKNKSALQSGKKYIHNESDNVWTGPEWKKINPQRIR